jgi:hypothetical protein
MRHVRTTRDEVHSRDVELHDESGATEPHIADGLLKPFAIRRGRAGLAQVASSWAWIGTR